MNILNQIQHVLVKFHIFLLLRLPSLETKQPLSNVSGGLELIVSILTQVVQH